MLRLRRLIRLLLDAIGNNVNMGRHCVFLTRCLFLAEGMVEGTPGKGMLSGLRLRRGLVLPVRKECRLTAGCGSSALRCQPEGGDM